MNPFHVLNTFLLKRKVILFYMGEAILIKALGGGSGSGGTSGTATEGIYTTNGYYTCSRSGNYKITCVGGGGGGHHYMAQVTSKYMPVCGGGSGFFSADVVYLNKSASYVLTIGAGGASTKSSTNAYSGGTTSFANLISANGGEGAVNNGTANGGNNGEAGTVSSGAFGGGNNNTYGNGGKLWVYGYDVTSTEIEGYSERLYYGDGGDGIDNDGADNVYSNGNSGCILIQFVD